MGDKFTQAGSANLYSSTSHLFECCTDTIVLNAFKDIFIVITELTGGQKKGTSSLKMKSILLNIAVLIR